MSMAQAAVENRHLTFLVIALLDIIMLVVIGLQTIWRERVAQLVFAAVCSVGFALLLLYLVSWADMFSYFYGSVVGLVEISLSLTTAASIIVLVYLIRAVTGTQRPPPVPPLYATASYAAPPPPPPVGRAEVPGPPYLGPPPIPPGRRAEAGSMPVALGIVVACIFGASLLLKLFGFSQRGPDMSSIIVLGLFIDVGMIAYGIFQSKLSLYKLQFGVLVVIVLILGYFFLTSFYFIMSRYIYSARHWSMIFYLFQILSFLRLGAAVTALFFSARSAFGGPRISPGALDPRYGAR